MKSKPDDKEVKLDTILKLEGTVHKFFNDFLRQIGG